MDDAGLAEDVRSEQAVDRVLAEEVDASGEQLCQFAFEVEEPEPESGVGCEFESVQWSRFQPFSTAVEYDPRVEPSLLVVAPL